MSMKDLGRTFALRQPLKPGDNAVWLTTNGDGSHDYSVVVGPSDGVDATVVLDVRNGKGEPVAALLKFYVVSFKEGTTSTPVDLPTVPTRSDTAHFKSSLPKVAAGRSARLRVMVTVPDGVTDAVVERGQVLGWFLAP